MSERVRPETEDDRYPASLRAGARWAVPLPGGCELEPVPFVGPYLGVVCGVLCALVGAFLLLAPFAFDYRRGAAQMPRAAVVDLATGAGVLLVGLLTAGLFGAALARRLRARPALPAVAPTPLLTPVPPYASMDDDDDDDFESEYDEYEPENLGTPVLLQLLEQDPEAEPEPEPEPDPEPEPAAPPPIDPSGALRELLTPLVAALAADLRARDMGEGLGPDHAKD